MFLWLFLLLIAAVAVAVLPIDGQVRRTFNIIIIVAAVIVSVVWLLPLFGADVSWDWPRRR